jgi:hypothetical protein
MSYPRETIGQRMLYRTFCFMGWVLDRLEDRRREREI